MVHMDVDVVFQRHSTSTMVFVWLSTSTYSNDGSREANGTNRSENPITNVNETNDKIP